VRVPAAFAALLALAAAHPKLPPYPKTLRCAALIAGSLKGRDLMSAEGRVLFDAGIFWGFASADAARVAKRSHAQFKQDERTAAATAAPQVAAKDPAALAELDACLKAVPPLKKP